MSAIGKHISIAVSTDLLISNIRWKNNKLSEKNDGTYTHQNTQSNWRYWANAHCLVLLKQLHPYTVQYPCTPYWTLKDRLCQITDTELWAQQLHSFRSFTIRIHVYPSKYEHVSMLFIYFYSNFTPLNDVRSLAHFHRNDSSDT